MTQTELKECRKCRALIPPEEDDWVRCNRCGYQYPNRKEEKDVEIKPSEVRK